MDILLEFVLELFLEGSIELSSNKKISKWIRYPLMFFVILFFISVIGFIFFLGIFLFSKNKIVSVLMISLGIFMLVGTILKFRELYYQKK